MKDIPNEVMWVWTLEYIGQPVGSDTMDKIDGIIDKYPTYFKWEHLYKSIPQEVHDAYSKEAYPDRWKPIVWNDNKGKGLMNLNEPVTIKPITIESFDKFFKDIEDMRIKDIEDERLKHIKFKAIWDKHYSKYKLKYRK